MHQSIGLFKALHYIKYIIETDEIRIKKEKVDEKWVTITIIIYFFYCVL